MLPFTDLIRIVSFSSSRSYKWRPCSRNIRCSEPSEGFSSWEHYCYGRYVSGHKKRPAEPQVPNSRARPASPSIQLEKLSICQVTLQLEAMKESSSETTRFGRLLNSVDASPISAGAAVSGVPM